MNDLDASLKALSEAHGPQALAAAFASLQSQVRRNRRRELKELGPLAQTFRDARLLMDQQRAAGVPKEERIKGLAAALKQMWPVVREWKYLCDQCDDYGLVMTTCPGDATCGRVKPHQLHDYGVPCWCKAGGKFKAKPKPAPDEFTESGRGKSKPTRWGGR